MTDEKTVRSSPALRRTFDWTASLISALVVVAVIYTFFFRVVAVSGESMEATLRHGDHLIMITRFYTLEHGDVVVIDREGDEPLIKRVIAMAGDTLEIEEETGTVYLNGQVLDEPYVRDGMTPSFDFDKPYTVPDGYVFAMGDNRCWSLDSRELGAFSENAVLGEAVYRIAPFDSIGSLKGE